jgi:protein TonB
MIAAKALHTEASAPASAAFDPPNVTHEMERHGYQPPPGARLGGVAGTALVAVLALLACLVTWTRIEPVARPSAPLVVDLLPSALPPAPRTQAEPKPNVEPKHQAASLPPKIDLVSPTVKAAPIATPPAAPTKTEPQAAPQTKVEAPPKTLPAPPAPQPASNAPDSWEGRVLARIAKFRRYPGSARQAYEQGVVYVRFRMDREGHVLTASVVRGSEYPDLDQAALDTVRRADPLPSIPQDRPEELELAVPIEFYIR